METPLIRLADRDIHLFCFQAAKICTSKEFKSLYKEMFKLYRQRNIQEAKLSAFRDSLFSLYVEKIPDQSHYHQEPM